MSDDIYVIFGSEYSPFSVKLRSYFRYKGIPHEWRPRTQENYAEFQKYAKLPLIPLVLGPKDEVLQDSTPIMEKMEERFPEKPIQPPSETLAYLSTLLEDYGDEWVNKPMFHYRWWRDEDQQAVGDGLARALLPNGDAQTREEMAGQIRKRMVPRLSFVGSNEITKDTIEESLDNLLTLLEKHLSTRSYIFGGQPSFADFGLWGQIYSCMLQPTTEKLIRTTYPNLLDWIERMLDPETTGGWEDWPRLSSTLEPLLKSEIGDLYLPWSEANGKAVFGEQPEFTVKLNEREFTQQSAKYSARSLQALKNKLSALGKVGELEEILLKTNCLPYLVAQDW
ncbi:MAG: glutathione S-transferase family protein [Proteobacteria bacterium]|nr:glutathione S-transferase family protein [Pseudomonadota bacterium]